jgi:HEAT repeat protein
MAARRRPKKGLRVLGGVAVAIVSALAAGWLGLYACLKIPDTSGFAALAVGALKIDSLGPAVVPMLKHTRTYDSDMAAWALGRLGDPRYISSLIDLLRTGGAEETESAADALLAIGDDRAVPELAAIASDSSQRLFARRYARHIIARITDSPSLAPFKVPPPAESWWLDESGGSRYKEEEQIDVFGGWWQKNKHRYAN